MLGGKPFKKGAQRFQAHVPFSEFRPFCKIIGCNSVVFHPFDDLLAFPLSDVFNESQYSKPADRFIRVHHHPHVGQKILDMGGLQKFETAVFYIGDSLPGQFGFQFEGMISGAKKNSELLKTGPFPHGFR